VQRGNQRGLVFGYETMPEINAGGVTLAQLVVGVTAAMGHSSDRRLGRGPL
jgi:hypothetical protein